MPDERTADRRDADAQVGGPDEGATIHDDPLPNLARRITEAHQQCEAAVSRGVALAAEVGRLLSEARTKVRPGGWLAWVRAHCPFSVRTAQNYLRVSGLLAGGDAKRVSHLPLRQALAALSPLGRGREGDREEREAVLAITDAPQAADVLRLMEHSDRDPDSCIRTAVETGVASDGYFVVRLTPQEQAAMAELPIDGGRALPVAGVLARPGGEVRPVQRIGGRYNPKDRIGPGFRRDPLVLLEVEGGAVVPVDAEKFQAIRRRRRKAKIVYDAGRQLVLFRTGDEAQAAIVCSGRPLDDVGRALGERLAEARAALQAVEDASAGLRPSAAARVAFRLDKVVAELSNLQRAHAPQAAASA